MYNKKILIRFQDEIKELFETIKKYNEFKSEKDLVLNSLNEIFLIEISNFLAVANNTKNTIKLIEEKQSEILQSKYSKLHYSIKKREFETLEKGEFQN
jgi:hypothetical protein